MTSDAISMILAMASKWRTVMSPGAPRRARWRGRDHQREA